MKCRRRSGSTAITRIAVAERSLDPGDQPAAADGDDDGVGVGRVLLDLEPDGAGARDHERIVERVHERAARLLDQTRRRRSNASPGSARLEVDGRAIAARRGDLLLGGALPHHHQRVDALLRGGERDGLGMVAGADRDHAAAPLLRR